MQNQLQMQNTAGDPQPGSPQQNPESFPNLMAVFKYLQDAGFTVKQSTLYNHFHRGMIPHRKDRSFALVDVKRYAKLYLQKKNGAAADIDIDPAQREKVDLDNAIRREKLALLKKKNDDVEKWLQDQLAGLLVPRAITLLADLENFSHGAASKIVALVEGNQGKIPELVEFLKGETKSMVARYAEPRAWTVTGEMRTAYEKAFPAFEREEDSQNEDEGETESDDKR